MPPAARITDMHVCPMVTGVVPHVGGPILPPCAPTVLIGYLPAARVADMATCVGPPDVILMGSPTVLIGYLMAARIGDPTAHGGVIVLGCFTVIIGEAGAPSPSTPSMPTSPALLEGPATTEDASKATATPSNDEEKAIAQHLAKGEYQQAIDKTIEHFGIDVSNVSGKMTYDSKLTEANAETSPNRKIRVGPSALKDVTPGRLAGTLIHESTHANQIAKHGFPKTGQEVAAYEAMGYASALNQADRIGLTSEQKDWYQKKVDGNHNKLSADNKKKYDGGQYWDLK